MRFVKARGLRAGDAFWMLDGSPAPALVVIVEDDAAVRASLKFAMELQGFQVEVCAAGEDLLRLELPASRACLVLDQRLPGKSGLQTLAELRARGVELPAVLITSHPQPQLRAAAAEAGVSIIEKPLLGDALTGWIGGTLAG